ncbi:MAG: hypothetical protein QXU32_00910 [Nitrososphaerales archaeon]
MNSIISERVIHVLDAISKKKDIRRSMVELDQLLHKLDTAFKMQDTAQIEGLINQAPNAIRKFYQRISQSAETKPKEVERQNKIEQSGKEKESEESLVPQIKRIDPRERPIMTKEAETAFINRVATNVEMMPTASDRRVALLRGYAEYLQAGGKLPADQFIKQVKSKLSPRLTSLQRRKAEKETAEIPPEAFGAAATGV